jgi:hypothetical protein
MSVDMATGTCALEDLCREEEKDPRLMLLQMMADAYEEGREIWSENRGIDKSPPPSVSQLSFSTLLASLIR